MNLIRELDFASSEGGAWVAKRTRNAIKPYELPTFFAMSSSVFEDFVDFWGPLAIPSKGFYYSGGLEKFLEKFLLLRIPQLCFRAVQKALKQALLESQVPFPWQNSEETL